MDDCKGTMNDERCGCGHSSAAHYVAGTIPARCSRCTCARFDLSCAGCLHKWEDHLWPSGICISCPCTGFRGAVKK